MKCKSEDFNKIFSKEIETIKNKLGNPPDLVIYQLSLPFQPYRQQKGWVVFFSSLTEEQRVSEEIIRPIQESVNLINLSDGNHTFPKVKLQELITTTQIESVENIEQIVLSLLDGYSLLIINDQSFKIDLKKGVSRSINEPENEKAVRGPKDGFIEDTSTNITLIRKRLRHPDFRIEQQTIGDKSKVTVSLFYVEKYVDKDLLQEARSRLKAIALDTVIDVSFIEETIRDSKWSPFPTIEYTERPDKMVASLLEGRVAIMVEGSPSCLLAPTLFTHFLTSSDDQYIIPYAATAIRWLRMFALILAFTLPSLFVALTTIHHGMVPPFLAVTIAKARTGMPFPTAVEVLLMEILMELVREAGLRMPGPIGQSVTIVGTLVIGEAAVSAGIVSAPVVVIIALTTLASFAIPGYHTALAIRLLRFPMIGISSFLGLVGITWYLMLIFIHLVSIRSFGIPYMKPFAPWSMKDAKDTFLRFPRWLLSLSSPTYARPKHNPNSAGKE